jgi:hypothetical protein
MRRDVGGLAHGQVFEQLIINRQGLLSANK